MAHQNIEICRFLDHQQEILNDEVATEAPLTVFVNGYEIATLLCTPRDLKALAVGFLASEGLLDSADQIKDIDFDYEETIVKVELTKEIRNLGLLGRRTLTSGCGRGVTYSNVLDCGQALEIDSTLEVKFEHIQHVMNDMQSSSHLFLLTGGTHTVALADNTGILFVAEDIGRHNAVDKVVGQALLKGVNFSDKVLLASGRISSEMVLKVLRRGVPIVVSRAAPTAMAVEMARERGLTLLGFVRGRRMNIYSGEHRVKLESADSD